MKHTEQAAPSARTLAGLEPHVDLLYQALESELGGVEVYTAALSCVQNEELREEWQKYLAQTKSHVEIVRALCAELELDPERDTPSRQIVRGLGKALVEAILVARGAGDPKAAEITAAECVALAETKDHANWSAIGQLAANGQGRVSKALAEAYAEVEEEEDEHLYHTSGWARELWLDALGLPAQLPPPEEEEDVHTAEEAARAKRGSAKR